MHEEVTLKIRSLVGGVAPISSSNRAAIETRDLLHAFCFTVWNAQSFCGRPLFFRTRAVPLILESSETNCPFYLFLVLYRRKAPRRN